MSAAERRGAVGATEAEIERRVRDASALARIEEKLCSMDEKLDDAVAYTRDVSGRVKVLELWRSGAAAVVAFVILIAGYVKWGNQ